ncbi:MAG TPA: VOC family protein [Lapillicoccus sp.]|nr:VOC family protein [Lapillicoccus sp.]
MSTAPTTTLHTYLGYRDATAAIDWLQRALGFDLVRRWPEDGDTVAHAELRRGDAALTLYTDEVGYDRPPVKGDTSGIGIYLAVPAAEDVDELYASATAAGGSSVWVPEQSEWNYRCRVVDPQGVEWTVGTYRPGEPAAW